MKKDLVEVPKELFPVDAVINVPPKPWFGNIARDFFSGVGSEYNDAGIIFPREEADVDVPDGFVTFYVLDEVVTIPIDEAKSYFRSALISYFKEIKADLK